MFLSHLFLMKVMTGKKMIIRNGLQKINFLFFLVIFFTSVDIVLAENIQLGPLINLDQIEPSYDSLDETLLQNKPVSESFEEGIIVDEKDLNFASLSVLNKITAKVEKLDIKLKENFNYGELRIYPIDCYLS